LSARRLFAGARVLANSIQCHRVVCLVSVGATFYSPHFLWAAPTKHLPIQHGRHWQHTDFRCAVLTFARFDFKNPRSILKDELITKCQFEVGRPEADLRRLTPSCLTWGKPISSQQATAIALPMPT
jgi:hypothetical protein